MFITCQSLPEKFLNFFFCLWIMPFVTMHQILFFCFIVYFHGNPGHINSPGQTESRNVAAMIHRHATFRIQPVWLNRTTPRHVIPSERSEPRNLSKQQVLSCVGSSFHVVDSSTPLRYGRNDMSTGGSIHPHGFYSLRTRNGTQAVPYSNAGMCHCATWANRKNVRF